MSTVFPVRFQARRNSHAYLATLSSLFRMLAPVFIASQLPRDLGRVVGRPRWPNTFLRDSSSLAAKWDDAVLRSTVNGKRDAVGTDVDVGFSALDLRPHGWTLSTSGLGLVPFFWRCR